MEKVPFKTGLGVSLIMGNGSLNTTYLSCVVCKRIMICGGVVVCFFLTSLHNVDMCQLWLAMPTGVTQLSWNGTLYWTEDIP